MRSSGKTSQLSAQEILWQRYSDNWVRHLGLVAEAGDRSVREALEASGYTSLDSQLIAPLSLLYLEKQRASTMATALGVSQAYTTKLLNRLEKSGYIERSEDATDRRARGIQLSGAGRKLIRSALEKLKEISLQHRQLLGDKAYDGLLQSLAETGRVLVTAEQRTQPPPGLESELSAVVLSAVSQLVQLAIGRLNTESGHGRLSIAHWRVLHDIGLSGSTNAELAEKQALSTQAISRTVRELLSMGYLERSRDQQDRRVSTLVYSRSALELLDCTAENIGALGDIVAREWGAGPFRQLCSSLSRLNASSPRSSTVESGSPLNTQSVGERLKLEFAELVDTLISGQGGYPSSDSIFSAAEIKYLAGIVRSRM